MNRVRVRVCLLAPCLLMLLFVAAISASAQGVSLTGRIADAQGAVVVGVTVTLASQPGPTHTSRSDVEGTFRFDNLASADYTLTAEAPGFATLRQRVTVGAEAMSLPLTLEIAGLSEGISVTGAGAPRTTVLAKTGVPVVEQPRAISVVPRALLDQRIVLEVSDALRTVSGVGQVGNYAQFRPSYVLRGFSLSRVFEDGFNVGTVGRTVELADTEQIEVLKGPSGALYGNINPGGILNLVSKRADAGARNTLQLTATSQGLYRPQLDVSGPIGRSDRVHARGILAYEQGDSYRDDVSRRTFFINPTISWKASDRTRFDVLARYHRARGTHDQGWPVSRSLLHVPAERLLNETSDTAEYDNGAVRTWVTHTFGPRWQLRGGLNTSFADYDNRFQTFRLPANADLDLNGTLVTRLPINEQGRAREYIGQGDLTGEFHTGVLRHRLAVGVELTSNNNRSTSFADARYPNTIDYRDTVYRAPVPDVLVTDFFDDRSSGNALSVQDQIALASWLDVAVGGRVDALTTKRLRENTGLRTERRDTNVAPFAGIVVKPARGVMLFGNYSEAFTTQIGTQLQGGAMPDPNLGSQYEGGIKTETPDRRLSASVSLFQITYRNILVAVPGQSYSIQSGVQRSRGLEAEVNGRVASGWDVSLAYTSLNAFVKQDSTLPIGATLANAADSAFSLWNHLAVPRLHALSAGLGVFYMGERPANLIAPTSTNPGGNTVWLPGYTRVDASVGFDTQGWRTTLYLENLTDVYYLSARGPVFHPNPPRSARLSIAHRF